MKTILAFILATLSAFSSSAFAESLCTAENTTFGAHLATYHFDRKAGYNETNPGLYARFCGGFTAGVYKNSYKDTSFYAGYTVSVGPVDVTMGAITGYPRGTIPMIVPSIRLPFAGARLAFLAPIPGVKDSAGGIHLMVDF